MNDADKAYIERNRPDPDRETLDTFKDLVAVIIVVACITLLSYVVWGTT